MKNRSPITTHVLDLCRGSPAANLAVTLERQGGTEWISLAQAATNADGRIEGLLPPGSQAEKGIYRLTFETAPYFKAQGLSCFYPRVSVIFELARPEEHHHVPLLLSPHGYSTYRGT